MLSWVRVPGGRNTCVHTLRFRCSGLVLSLGHIWTLLLLSRPLERERLCLV